MAFNYRTGPNNAAEYQASGLPYVTQSVATTSPFNIQFPFVTNELTVKNNTAGNNVAVGFQSMLGNSNPAVGGLVAIGAETLQQVMTGGAHTAAAHHLAIKTLINGTNQFSRGVGTSGNKCVAHAAGSSKGMTLAAATSGAGMAGAHFTSPI